MMIIIKILFIILFVLAIFSALLAISMLWSMLSRMRVKKAVSVLADVFEMNESHVVYLLKEGTEGKDR